MELNFILKFIYMWYLLGRLEPHRTIVASALAAAAANPVGGGLGGNSDIDGKQTKMTARNTPQRLARQPWTTP